MKDGKGRTIGSKGVDECMLDLVPWCVRRKEGVVILSKLIGFVREWQGRERRSERRSGWRDDQTRARRSDKSGQVGRSQRSFDAVGRKRNTIHRISYSRTGGRYKWDRRKGDEVQETGGETGEVAVEKTASHPNSSKTADLLFLLRHWQGLNMEGK